MSHTSSLITNTSKQYFLNKSIIYAHVCEGSSNKALLASYKDIHCDKECATISKKFKILINKIISICRGFGALPVQACLGNLGGFAILVSTRTLTGNRGEYS